MRNIEPPLMSVDESLNSYGKGLHKETEIDGVNQQNSNYAIFHAEKANLRNYFLEYNEKLKPCCLEEVKPHYDDEGIRNKLYNLYNRQRKYMQRVWESVAKKDGVLQMCPICGVKHISDWDHYIPRSVMPEYSIHVQNLIPTCRDCNGDKHEAWLENGKRIFFNAYYDKAVDLSKLLQVSVSVSCGSPMVSVELKKFVKGEPECVRIAISTIKRLSLIETYWQEKANEVMRYCVKQCDKRIQVRRKRDPNVDIAEMWKEEKEVIREMLIDDSPISFMDSLVGKSILSSADFEKWFLSL